MSDELNKRNILSLSEGLKAERAKNIILAETVAKLSKTVSQLQSEMSVVKMQLVQNSIMNMGSGPTQI